jgi:hypothetical protein
MQFLSASRIAASALVLGALALGSSIVGSSAASTTLAARAAAPQETDTASLITRRPGTLAPGAKARSRQLGERVFTDASHGFALASIGQAQYPAATSNGGKTWKTDGPALHVNAAQAPLVVTEIGAANRSTVFAYGSGQVIDTTSDGGTKWYGALFNGLVMAVVPGSSGRLVAFVDTAVGSGASGPTRQYVSSDGGRSWRYDTAVGGGA